MAKEALEIANTVRDYEECTRLSNNLAIFYLGIDPRKSLNYIEQALSISSKVSQESHFYILAYKIKILLFLGQERLAEKVILEATNLISKSDNLQVKNYLKVLNLDYLIITGNLREVETLLPALIAEYKKSNEKSIINLLVSKKIQLEIFKGFLTSALDEIESLSLQELTEGMEHILRYLRYQIFFNLRKYKDALSTIQELIEYNEKAGDEYLTFYYKVQLVRLLISLGEFQEAKVLIDELEKQANMKGYLDETIFPDFNSQFALALGEFFYYQEIFKEAQKFFKKLYNIAKREGVVFSQANALTYLANISIITNEKPEVEKYISELENILSNIDFKGLLIDLKIIKALYYLSFTPRYLDVSKNLLFEGLNLANELETTEKAVRICFELAKVFFEEGALQQALNFGLKASSTVLKISDYIPKEYVKSYLSKRQNKDITDFLESLSKESSKFEQSLRGESIPLKSKDIEMQITETIFDELLRSISSSDRLQEELGHILRIVKDKLNIGKIAILPYVEGKQGVISEINMGYSKKEINSLVKFVESRPMFEGEELILTDEGSLGDKPVAIQKIPVAFSENRGYLVICLNFVKWERELIDIKREVLKKVILRFQDYIISSLISAKQEATEEAKHIDVREKEFNSPYPEIVGQSMQIRKVIEFIDRVKDVDLPILITGETGTGKELVARVIHKYGNRKNGPYLPINCTALPETLIESELFGHVRGAFTSALSTEKGLIIAANGGILFLDEIGDMPLHLQPKLLRVIEEKRLIPIGSSRPENFDVRFIAATNRSVDDLLKGGILRHDLYYRLSALSIQLPPLRERKEDIPQLVDFFINKTANEMKLSLGQKRIIDEKAIRLFTHYSWPGNVRELENFIKSLLHHYLNRKTLTYKDIEKFFQERKNVVYPAKIEKTSLIPLKEVVKLASCEAIKETLKATNGNREEAAKLLGISRRHLQFLLKRYSLS